VIECPDCHGDRYVDDTQGGTQVCPTCNAFGELLEGEAPCKECGLPITQCSALTVARKAAETYLRASGYYGGLEARRIALELIPVRAREPDPMPDIINSGSTDNSGD
jgi:predicted amidophosphoribosyltransferase